MLRQLNCFLFEVRIFVSSFRWTTKDWPEANSRRSAKTGRKKAFSNRKKLICCDTGELASCTGDLDGISTTLEFKEFINVRTGEPIGGKGFVTQRMGGLFEVESLISISGDNPKQIKMFAVLEPEFLFAEFSLETQTPSELEIFAIEFNAIWGTFACTPAPASI